MTERFWRNATGEGSGLGRSLVKASAKHFGIEFLQCPLNAGPTSVSLEIPLQAALDTYLQPGLLITTKMVWSFGDSLDEAMT